MQQIDGKKWINLALELLYPPCCPFCGELTKEGRVCSPCLKKLPKITENACLYCGREKKKCICREQVENYSAVVAPFYYVEGVQGAIHRYKFSSQKEHYRVFADYMAREVQKRYTNKVFDLCTAVPTAKKTIRKRGFDHTGILAKEVARLLQIPYEPLLKKIQENQPQKELTQDRRRGNVLGVYQVLDVDVTDKNILLIDDLKTTGSTLNECAKMLLLAKANAVYAAVLAVTKQDELTENKKKE